MKNDPLSTREYRESLGSYIETYFELLVNKEMYSLIINRDLEVEIATNFSAQSIGYKSWKSLRGLSCDNYNCPALFKKIFGNKYSKTNHDTFVRQCEKLYLLQQTVIKQGKIIKFIDMLPYGGRQKIFTTSYFPIIHKSGEVIGIHSTSVESSLPRLSLDVLQSDLSLGKNLSKLQLSAREHEILFLLCYGNTQEKISQVLQIARSTVASIIANQLCPKFSIIGSNARLLVAKALSIGIHLDLPATLWRPCIIVSNDEIGKFCGI